MNPRTLCGLFTVLKGPVSKDLQNPVSSLNSSPKWGPLHLAIDWARGQSSYTKGELCVAWMLHLAFLRMERKEDQGFLTKTWSFRKHRKLFHPGFMPFIKKITMRSLLFHFSFFKYVHFVWLPWCCNTISLVPTRGHTSEITQLLVSKTHHKDEEAVFTWNILSLQQRKMIKMHHTRKRSLVFALRIHYMTWDAQ